MKGVTFLFVGGFILMSVAKGHRMDDRKATCSKRIDLAFILDASASVGETNYNNFKRFTHELINRFTLSPSKSKISLNFFSAKHHIISRFSDEYTKSELMRMALELPFEGSFSNLAKTVDGVHFAVFSKAGGARLADPDPPCDAKPRDVENDDELGDDDDDELKPVKKRDPGAKKVAVFLTDAYGTQGAEEVAYKAKSLKDFGVEIFTVGVPGENHNAGVRALVSLPQHKHEFRLTHDKQEMKSIFDKLVKRICKIRAIRPYNHFNC